MFGVGVYVRVFFCCRNGHHATGALTVRLCSDGRSIRVRAAPDVSRRAAGRSRDAAGSAVVVCGPGAGTGCRGVCALADGARTVLSADALRRRFRATQGDAEDEDGRADGPPAPRSAALRAPGGWPRSLRLRCGPSGRVGRAVRPRRGAAPRSAPAAARRSSRRPP